MSPNKQRVVAILLESIHRIPATLLGENVNIRWTTNAKQGCVTNISLIFEFPGKSPMRMDMEMYDDDKIDPYMWIHCSYEAARIRLGHLSALGGAEYSKIAKALGIAHPLDEAAHMTEFCVALIAPLFEAYALVPYLESIETIERDGIQYYAGHGGTMRALFRPMFRESDGLRIDHDD